MARFTDFVIVPSKLCNLRCSYCYEYPDLGDKRRMTLEQVARIFERVADHHRGSTEPIELRWIWHGGEPLLIPPEWYRQVFELQRRAFAGLNARIVNGVQTNLTVLDQERLDLLAESFDHVGVSIDFFGGLRKNKSGVCQEHKTLANLERLLQRRPAVGGITVLTKRNLPHLDEIFDFYRARKMSFSLLPLKKGPFEQGQGFEISAHDTRAAFCRLFDLWMEHEYVQITPIVTYVRMVLESRSPHRVRRSYDKAAHESVILIDRDGRLYGYNDPYDPDRCYGNILESPLAELFKSRGHLRVVGEAELRMQATCSGCEYFGKACSGVPIAEGGNEYTERDSRGALECIAYKGLIQHIERRLTEHGYLDTLTGAFTARGRNLVQRPSVSSG